jgi:hypothetical protein
MGKNAKIIRVVNGLAFSMVTVFEDIFHYLYKIIFLLQADRGFAAVAFSFLGGKGGVWAKKGVTLRGGGGFPRR